jgi:dTDP-4-amino-4,6-dideoxygalactose transaminase
MSPLSLPDFTGVQAEDIMRVMHLCERGKGEEVLAAFEKEFAQRVGSKYAIALSSATAGLHLAMLALEIGKGDEVVCPTFTFAASAFPIVYQQALPVFVDSEMETWNMSPLYLEEAIGDRISKGKKPKAIVVVHGYGTPADLSRILQIAHQYAIPIVEDAANALGATWEGKQVGGFGKIGVFSFNRNKILSAGSGGVLVTEDENIAKKVRYLAHQAKSPASYYQHEGVGYNYGISPILAEILRLQLPTLTDRVEKRSAAFVEHTLFFKQKAIFQRELEGMKSNHWLTVLRPSSLPLTEWPVPREHVRRVWKPMHTQPVFSELPYYGKQESVAFFETGFCLPFLQKVGVEVVSR